MDFKAYRPVEDDEKTDLMEKSGGRSLRTTRVDKIKPGGKAKHRLVVHDVGLTKDIGVQASTPLSFTVRLLGNA